MTLEMESYTASSSSFHELALNRKQIEKLQNEIRTLKLALRDAQRRLQNGPRNGGPLSHAASAPTKEGGGGPGNAAQSSPSKSTILKAVEGLPYSKAPVGHSAKLRT